jgi:23S rRNA (adenine2503-C2)-methyltransferase
MDIARLSASFPFSAPFRARQVYGWIVRNAAGFGQMTDIPLGEREHLTRLFPSLYSSVVEKELEDSDGSLKLQIRLRDGSAVECVLLEDIEGRTTACLSCQVGCPMACTFCKTGSIGFLRNLGVDEIMEQYRFLRSRRTSVSNVVFMGMGEPMLNLEAVRGAISLLVDPDGIGMSRRKITISTCGIVPGILDLARNGPAVRLAVSLTSADEATRSALMPVNRTWNLASLRNALMVYRKSTGERVTLEAALMGNANTTPEAAEALVRWARPLDAQINLIPWNRVPGLPFTEPDRDQVERFQRILEEAGLLSTRRMRRGRGIMGACGQLGDTLRYSGID